MEETLRLKHIDGVSGYADSCRDGAEAIAEAIVRKRNGYALSLRVKYLLEQFVEVWRK